MKTLRQAFGPPRQIGAGAAFVDLARRQAIARATVDATCAFLVTRTPA